MAEPPAIETAGLSKTYGGDVRALVDLDLRVERGEVFGYLGPNGAGKSTTAAPRPNWGTFKDNIRASLAVYDGLDTTCGNQLLANTAQVGPARYDPLADALADDRIYLNSSRGTCTQYLGVELNATGLVPNSDCGGRTPNYDSIDVTFTALGSTLAAPLGDNVNSDNVVHSVTAFPFLSPPLP